MASNTHTLLNVVNTIGFKVGDFKDRITTLENPDPATDYIVYCVNAAIRAMNRRKPVRNESSFYVFNTTAPYTTGTVSVTEGSTAITGSGTTWDASWKTERAFATDTDLVAYRLASANGTTGGVLDAAYVGATDSGETYKIMRDRYALAADFSDIEYAWYDGPAKGDIAIRMGREMDRQRATMSTSSAVTGKPTHLTIWDKDASGNWLLEFDPFPDDVYRINLRVTTQPTTLTTASGATTVQVDDESIDTLIDGACAMWMDKDEKGTFMAWKQSGLQEWMIWDSKRTDNNPQLVPDDALRPQNAAGRRRNKDIDFLGR